MSAADGPRWSFLTNHARVLISIAEDPTIRLRELGSRLGITERAAHRIVSDLATAGYVARERHGRRNHYTVRRDLPLPDHILRANALDDLLGVIVPSSAGRSAAADVMGSR